jgi:hypothetical protein
MKDFLFQTVYANSIDNSPTVNSAANGGGRGISFDSFLSNINDQIVTPIIYLLFALATVYFLYGVYLFVKNAESPDKRSEGAQSMIWGIIGLFIMLSVKGIINLILRTVGAI